MILTRACNGCARAERKRIQASRNVLDRDLLVGGPVTFSPQLVAKPFARRLAAGLDALLRGLWSIFRPLCPRGTGRA